MNALDAAAIILAKCSTALERHANPTFDDVEEAEGLAKDAHKILKNARELMEEGIYDVAEPPMAGTPLPFEDTTPVAALRRAQKQMSEGLKEGETVSMAVGDGPFVEIGRGRKK